MKRIIESDKNIYITKDGRVIDIAGNDVPKFRNNSGYLKVNLRKGKQEYVHRLVAKYFIINTENKPCVNHLDGNKDNNCVSNLEWVTYRENNLHAHNNGLQPKQDKRGLNNGNNKLNELQVRIIRRLRNDYKMKVKHIQEVFGIGTTTVHEIASGKRWSHI